MIKTSLAITAFWAGIMAAGSANAITTATAPTDLDSAIASALSSSQTPSAQVSVVKDGQVVFNRAYGLARLSPAVFAKPETRYQIASVSKEFVAAAALLLQEQGKLSLDDKVAKWFPDLTSADTITLRQLLSHTSGYSDYWPQDYVMTMVTVPTTSEAIANTYARAPLDYTPGEQWQYSNTGYVVAGRIIEKVTGQTLFNFMNDNLLTPVGITDATDISLAPLVAPDAKGYERHGLSPSKPAPEAGTNWPFGAWQLGLTAEDVAKWDLSILKKSLFKPETYATQVTPIKLNNGNSTGYAMGLFIRKDGGRTLYEHSGEGAGYVSENRIYPDDGVAIVVLTNTMSGSAAFDIADRLAFRYLPPQGVDAQMLSLFQDLQKGTADRTKYTPNFNAYLSDSTLLDLKQSVGSLGAVQSFKLTGTSDRGGMQGRSYRIRMANKTLNLSVYVTKAGLVEQFLISAAG